MYKLLSVIVLSSILLSSFIINADEIKSHNRQEMRELKQQQAELKAKQKLLRLKSTLNLQAEQTKAWEKYEQAVLEYMSQKRKMAQQLIERHRDSVQKPRGLELAQLNIERLELKLAKATNQYQALDCLLYTSPSPRD